jgi:hypothetical protein
MKTKINKSSFSLAAKLKKGLVGGWLLVVSMFALPASAADLYDTGYGYQGGGLVLDNVYGLPDGSILGIASNLLFWLLSLFAILGIIGFVLSGIFYLISAGEEDMVTRGKDGMKWSIVGILVGLSGFVIMQAVNLFLGGASKGF